MIGICISAAVLLPSAILLLQSARSGENLSYFGVMKRHGLDDLFERLFQIANPVLIGLLFASGCFWKRKRRSAAEQETHSAAPQKLQKAKKVADSITEELDSEVKLLKAELLLNGRKL